MMPDLTNWRERYRVRTGFVLGILFLWRAQPRNILFLILGLLIALLGIALRQWAAACVKKMDELATGGPYAIVRNPLYLGSFLCAVGFILASSSLNIQISRPYLDRTLFFCAALWILIESIYLPKVCKEESQLEEKFKEAFVQYKRSVPRFFPKSFRWSQVDLSTFQWELWKKNREIASLVGYLIIAIVLIGRYIYR